MPTSSARPKTLRIRRSAEPASVAAIAAMKNGQASRVSGPASTRSAAEPHRRVTSHQTPAATPVASSADSR
jgi:hypothetical protein